MSALYPFRALRPDPAVAARVASVPYDVVNTAEAKALADHNPLSFLHVTRAEIDLPAETNPYDARVYEQAVRNLEALKREAPLVIDDEPSLYVYRLRMGDHTQTGVAGCFSIDEYRRDLVKKHEKTRKDKEDDRTRHLVELRAQTGVVFLTYRATEDINRITAGVTKAAPLYEFSAPDGVVHTVWRATAADRDALTRAFAHVPALYIADGHHRAASAARASDTVGAAAAGEAGRFIAVAFPNRETRILPYNRVVGDLAGETPASLIGRMRANEIVVTHGQPVPPRAGIVSMFLDGAWYAIELPAPPPGTPRAEALDVEVLQKQILEPLLKVGDPRTDKRIDFVGGIRGTDALEQHVKSGRAAVAFSLYPVSVDDLMAIADAGGIMPPKSTWFEPKLRDGLLTHLI
jgi:uncharacterized protein (DUF1015 family)